MNLSRIRIARLCLYVPALTSGLVSICHAQASPITVLPAAETSETVDAWNGISLSGSVLTAQSSNQNPAIYVKGSGWSVLPYSSQFGASTDPRGAATGTSQDGSVIVGFTSGSVSGVTKTYNAYWSKGGAENLIPMPAGITGVTTNDDRLSTSVSSDGSTILENAYADGTGSLSTGDYGFTYTIANKTLTNVGALNDILPSTFVTIASSNGSQVAGLSLNDAGTAYDAFIATPGSTITDLGEPAGYPGATETVPTCMSANGSIVYGKFFVPAVGWRAFRWTASSGVMPLSSFLPTSCSADGSVVAGVDPAKTTYVVWTASTGVKYLSNLLSLFGVNQGTWTYPYYSDPVLSPDGSLFYCSGSSQGGALNNLQVTLPPSIPTITLSPSSITGGLSETATISLNSAAPTGGITLNLVSQIPAYVSVPTSITIPAGFKSATFSISTKSFRQNYNCSIKASNNCFSTTSVLTVVVGSGSN